MTCARERVVTVGEKDSAPFAPLAGGDGGSGMRRLMHRSLGASLSFMRAHCGYLFLFLWPTEKKPHYPLPPLPNISTLTSVHRNNLEIQYMPWSCGLEWTSAGCGQSAAGWITITVMSCNSADHHTAVTNLFVLKNLLYEPVFSDGEMVFVGQKTGLRFVIRLNWNPKRPTANTADFKAWKNVYKSYSQWTMVQHTGITSNGYKWTWNIETNRREY